MDLIGGVFTKPLSSSDFAIATLRILMYNLSDEQSADNIGQEMGNFAEQKTTLVHPASK